MNDPIEKTIKTSRLGTSYLEAGNPHNPLIVMIHGNLSSSLFWYETIKAFADEYWVIAPDIRGYGKTEPHPIRATRGLIDWSDDLKSFVEALKIVSPFHLIGWSIGGGIATRYAAENPSDLGSVILVDPMSPYGFGGTKDERGTPCNPIFSGSGAGAVNSRFLELLIQKYRGEDDPQSPRRVLSEFYFKPPFMVSREREEILLDSMLSTRLGEDFYPGDYVLCKEWPGFAPGGRGINNAISPKYANLLPLINTDPKCPILWVRGSDDLIVSDASYFCLGYLGKLGLVPDWPGEDIYPPQPMVTQTKCVLERYEDEGGYYEEFVVEGSGHSPHIEKPEIFQRKVASFLEKL